MTGTDELASETRARGTADSRPDSGIGSDSPTGSAPASDAGRRGIFISAGSPPGSPGGGPGNGAGGPGAGAAPAASGGVPGSGWGPGTATTGSPGGGGRVASRGAGSGGDGPGAAGILQTIRRRIEGARVYPARARDAGVEGTVELRFKVAADGSVAAFEILRSSGSSLLDADSETTVRRAAPYPVVNGWIRLPLAYRLEADRR